MSEEVEVIVPVIVLKAVEGKIVDFKHYEDRSLEDVVKEYTKKAVDEWNPALSDFTVMKTYYELRYKHPINPDLYDIVQALNLEIYREGDEVVVKLPVYTISYDNRWSGDTYRDMKIYVVTYVIDPQVVEHMKRYAIDTTAKPKTLEPSLELTEEEIKRLQEGLEEAERVEAEEEEAETSKRGRRRRKRK